MSRHLRVHTFEKLRGRRLLTVANSQLREPNRDIIDDSIIRRAWLVFLSSSLVGLAGGRSESASAAIMNNINQIEQTLSDRSFCC